MLRWRKDFAESTGCLSLCSRYFVRYATYFLHEYLGLIPRAGRAFESGDPALKFFFFPLYDKTVMWRLDDLRLVETCPLTLLNPWTEDANAATTRMTRIQSWIEVIFFFKYGLFVLWARALVVYDTSMILEQSILDCIVFSLMIDVEEQKFFLVDINHTSPRWFLACM